MKPPKERSTIMVFADSPEWDKPHEKWFMLPAHVLDSLYIATYEMDHDELPFPEDIAYVKQRHPGCVYVY